MKNQDTTHHTTAKEVWRMLDNQIPKSTIAKTLGINRSEVIYIEKYTHATMYHDTYALSFEVNKMQDILRNSHTKYFSLLKNCVLLNRKLSSFATAYHSTLPFKKYLFPAIVSALFVGFLIGGTVEKKIMNSFGHYVSLEDFSLLLK